MINFRLLRHFWYFMAVAEERHFGRAAKRLGVSQPPLSQQIQVLERTLGVKLFERSREGARLTREGSQILEPVRSFLDHAYRLETTVMDVRQGRGAGIAFGAINSALFDVMPHVLGTARRQYPALSLTLAEMDSAQALAAVRNGEIDLAFARFDHQISPLAIRPITTDHLVVALPIDHRLTHQAKVALNELADESLVLFPRRISPHYFDIIVAACRDAGFSRASCTRSDRSSRKSALSDAGLASVWSPAARCALAAAPLRFVRWSKRSTWSPSPRSGILRSTTSLCPGWLR